MTILGTFRLSVFYYILAITSLLVSSGVSNSQECLSGQWDNTGQSIYFREGCISLTGVDIRFASVALDLSQYKLTLTGSAPDGRVPTLEDVPSSSEHDNLSTFGLRSALERNKLPVLATVVGYPINEELFVPDGFLRIGGELMSNRDVSNSFKSALLCLNETRKNSGPGSRVVVFNAFEDHTPIEFNPRVENADNCPDVVQIGPRIIEYRSKPGIFNAARKDANQKYMVFSQGSGPNYYGYFTIFTYPVNLYYVQQLFLENKIFSQFDDKMRVAVTLTTGHNSAMAVLGVSKEYHMFENVDKPSPVFLIANFSN